MAGSWLRGVVCITHAVRRGSGAGAEGKVCVFAAASLTNAMQDVCAVCVCK